MRKILGILLLLTLLSVGQAASTVDAVDKFTYGANISWLNWRGDTNSGVVISETVCSGNIYAANVGWINLGSGSPTNSIHYQNHSANDFGVNIDTAGNLRGQAYGANIGWLTFENTGGPKVNLVTGQLSGSIWSANCGWISLNNSTAFVRTDAITLGADTDGDGIADAWERQNFGNLTTATATSDTDHDGVTDLQEYLADTNPNDPNDYLRITSLTRLDPLTDLQWTAKPTRFYEIQRRSAFDASSPWIGLGVPPILGFNSFNFSDSGSQSLYRIRVIRPLAP